MPRLPLPGAVALAATMLSIGCSSNLTSPDKNFSIQLGCTSLTVARGDLAECTVTIKALGGTTATIESVVLLANGKEMTNFTHSPGLSYYTDPIPDNLKGLTVDANGLSVDVRVFAETSVAPGTYPAGIRITYRLAGAASSTTPPDQTFDIVVT